MPLKYFAVVAALVFCSPLFAAEANFFDPELLRKNSAPGEAAAPRLLAARYLARITGPGEAAAEVLADEQAGRFDAATAGEIYREIAQYRQLNHYARAEFLARTLWREWGVDQYNRFWIDQAQAMLNRGEVGNPEQALRWKREPLNAAAHNRRQSLRGQIYLRQRRYAAALAALDKQLAIAGDGLFDHYHFGIALLRTGDQDRGMALLDEIGKDPIETSDHRALRDRVNLALGWHWLAVNQGGTAREYFKRVRLDGPFSNLSLLGLGWSELAPDGTRQSARFKRRVLCKDVEVPPDTLMRTLYDRYAPCRPGEKPGVIPFYHQFAFEPGGRDADRFERAIRWWRVLAARPTEDSAVQEALLAIAYTQQRRRVFDDATRSYQTAIQRLEEETRRLTALEAALRAPESDPLSVLNSQATVKDFATLRSSHRFVQQLAELDALKQSATELQMLGQRLDRLDSSADPERLRELRARREAQMNVQAATQNAAVTGLRKLCLDELQQKQEKLKTYLSRALLSLAVLYDKRSAP